MIIRDTRGLPRAASKGAAPREKPRRGRLRRAAILAVCGLAFAACAGHQPRRAPPAPAERGAEERGLLSLTLLAAGDNLIHSEILEDARRAGGGAYHFDDYYSLIQPLAREAGIAFINQETLIAGPAFGYSGYPAFNGPFEIGDALIRAGFTVINHATNHAMDKGEAALLSVLDFWQRYPQALPLGIRRTRDENRAVIVERRGIRVGFLSYTYGTNGIPLPKDKPYLVSLINTTAMAEDIERLRALCDFLVVSMHWGEEYQHTPSPRQIELARFLSERGVDLVIGHHPHVVQPAREFIRADGGRTLVIFSLGNFFSAQKETPRMLGALARVTIHKETSAAGTRTFINAAELIPIVTHYESDFRGFKVYPLDQYTPELARRHYLSGAEDFSVARLRALFANVTGALGAR